ncbi:kinase [Chlorella sorokiniana]|uniref:Kinase n=1 Tax=Chlorella sorokiniana TaxID=3076 RepID=A0A2P6U1V8_CHLSO|nr:kinase [Chlorella sorokiniana]|eukprot:PRW60302.1 kinase [Chlorella sorokiniana]
MASEEVALRIAQRLKEERAKLEERVMRQVEMEKKMLLERKRREDAERRQQQEEMERILEENKRKVEEAQRKAAEAAAEQQGLPKPGGGLPKPRRQGLILDDLPVLPSNFFSDPGLTGNWKWETDFKDVVEIGKGKDTVIYSATCPKLGAGRRVAVKVYDKTKVQATKYRAIKREIAMMMYFMRKRLPSVVDYYGAFHDDARLYIVMEYCGGGDLLEKLLRDKKAMNEKKVAIEVAYPCLSILQTLHEMRIIHRDIKLENIFIDDAGRVKLGDFGLTMSMRQESAISPVGTVEYMAPEVVALPPVDLVISGQIKATDIPPTNEKVDIWALGVTIYELVTGRLPFEGKDKPEIKRNITANNLAPLPSFLTPQCQSFIKAMLTYSVDQRPSCAQLLQHPYITMYCTPPVPKPATLPNVIALHAYSPGAGGRAPAPADDMRSPRTPGGSHVPVTVGRNAAASAQHSPTILAGGASPHDPFTSPLPPADHGGAAAGVPRKISFEFFSGGKAAAAAPNDAKRLGQQADQQSRRAAPAVSGSERKRQGMGGGVKATLRKLFTSRRGGHQRLPDEDMVDAEDRQHPMAAPVQQGSFTFGR